MTSDIKLPSGEQWLEIFRKAGVDIDAFLSRLEAEIDSYVQKLPDDPVLRQAILEQLDDETRRIIEAGDPLHIRFDTLTSLLRDSITSEQVRGIFYIAVQELAALVKTRKSPIKKRGIRMA